MNSSKLRLFYFLGIAVAAGCIGVSDVFSAGDDVSAWSECGDVPHVNYTSPMVLSMDLPEPFVVYQPEFQDENLADNMLNSPFDNPLSLLQQADISAYLDAPVHSDLAGDVIGLFGIIASHIVITKTL